MHKRTNNNKRYLFIKGQQQQHDKVYFCASLQIPRGCE